MRNVTNISFTLTLLLLTVSIKGQNLVPNPSFESFTTCPASTFEIDKATSWTSGGGSPDYYNACAIPGGVSVPDNIYGFQYAVNGNAYVGLYTYNRDVSWPGHREHVQTNLITPLIIGTKYYVSMDISFTIDAYEVGFAADKLGMLFTNVSTYDASNPPISNNSSQVFIDTIISDTVNWYHFEGSFIADSAYQTILVGNFFDDNNTDTLVLDTSFFTAYYYVDNVCVSSDSNDCLLAIGIEDISTLKNVKLFPNPTSLDVISLELPLHYLNTEIEYSIYNNIGQRLVKNSFYYNSDNTQIKLNHLSSGIYHLNITNGLEQASLKFIIN
ncbi:MAG: T9SS type A sorting domain-containing protein [Vicingaceae bacterium]